MASHAHEIHDDHHIISRATYSAIFALLLVLLVVTVWVARIDLGWLNFPVAMAIATVKAVFIVAYFMHLKASTQLVRLFAAAGFIFLGIMLLFVFGDYLARFPTMFGT